ncbi:Fc.00g001610.m01.CDS01 [Cosmosporella sp. VM-42]
MEGNQPPPPQPPANQQVVLVQREQQQRAQLVRVQSLIASMQEEIQSFEQSKQNYLVDVCAAPFLDKIIASCNGHIGMRSHCIKALRSIERLYQRDIAHLQAMGSANFKRPPVSLGSVPVAKPRQVVGGGVRPPISTLHPPTHAQLLQRFHSTHQQHHQVQLPHQQVQHQDRPHLTQNLSLDGPSSSRAPAQDANTSYHLGLFSVISETQQGQNKQKLDLPSTQQQQQASISSSGQLFRDMSLVQDLKPPNAPIAESFDDPEIREALRTSFLQAFPPSFGGTLGSRGILKGVPRNFMKIEDFEKSPQ